MTSVPGKPDSAAAALLLQRLANIHPAFAHPRSIDRARNVLLDIRQDKDDNTVLRNTRLRWQGTEAGDATHVDDEMGQRIIDVVTTTLDGG